MLPLSRTEKRVLDSHLIDYESSNNLSVCGLDGIVRLLPRIERPLDSNEMRSSPIFLRILGFSCSGKSTVCKLLTQNLPVSRRATHISLDDYTKNHTDQTLPKYQNDTDWESPEAFDLALAERDLAKLKKGFLIEAPYYDFLNSQRLKNTRIIFPAHIVVIEGITAGHIQLPNSEILNIHTSISENNFFIRRILRTRDFSPQEDLRYILKNMYSRFSALEAQILNNLDIDLVIESKFDPQSESRNSQFIALKSETHNSGHAEGYYSVNAFELDSQGRDGILYTFTSPSKSFFMYSYEFLVSPDKSAAASNAVFFNIDKKIAGLVSNTFKNIFSQTADIHLKPSYNVIRVQLFDHEKTTTIILKDRDLK